MGNARVDPMSRRRGSFYVGEVTARLPPPPYTLRVADLRVHCPDGEVRFEDEFVLPYGRTLALAGPGAPALAGALLGRLDYGGTATLNGVQLSDLAARDVRGVIRYCARVGVRLPDVPILIVEESAADLLPGAGDRTVLFVTRRSAVPGGTPALRRFDEVRVL